MRSTPPSGLPEGPLRQQPSV